MNEISFIAAFIAVTIFLGMSLFQFLLAFGITFSIPIPAYGGKYDKLPMKLRILSLVALIIFVLASILVLVTVNVLENFPYPDFATLGVWVLAFYLLLNTLGNYLSKSDLEKKIMTPISLLASLCLFIIAIFN